MFTPLMTRWTRVSLWLWCLTAGAAAAQVHPSPFARGISTAYNPDALAKAYRAFLKTPDGAAAKAEMEKAFAPHQDLIRLARSADQVIRHNNFDGEAVSYLTYPGPVPEALAQVGLEVSPVPGTKGMFAAKREGACVLSDSKRVLEAALASEARHPVELPMRGGRLSCTAVRLTAQRDWPELFYVVDPQGAGLMIDGLPPAQAKAMADQMMSGAMGFRAEGLVPSATLKSGVLLLKLKGPPLKAEASINVIALAAINAAVDQPRAAAQLTQPATP